MAKLLIVLAIMAMVALSQAGPAPVLGSLPVVGGALGGLEGAAQGALGATAGVGLSAGVGLQGQAAAAGQAGAAGGLLGGLGR